MKATEVKQSTLVPLMFEQPSERGREVEAQRSTDTESTDVNG